MGIEALLWVGLYLLCGFVTTLYVWYRHYDFVAQEVFFETSWTWGMILVLMIFWFMVIPGMIGCAISEIVAQPVPSPKALEKRHRGRVEWEVVSSEVVAVETRVAVKGNVREVGSFQELGEALTRMGSNLTLAIYEYEEDPFIETMLEVDRDYRLYIPLWRMQIDPDTCEPTAGGPVTESLFNAWPEDHYRDPTWIVTVEEVRTAFRQVMENSPEDHCIMNRAVLAYLEVIPGEWKVALCWW